MTPHDLKHCQTCGKALPPGVTECLHEELRVPGPARSEPTETVPPRAAAPLKAAPAAIAGLDSVAEEPERPEALVGRQLGEYSVRRYVGRGGMGVVYEGEHTTIGRKVAIKFIREEYARGPQARGLLSEARAASSIRHHGIIDIFGFGQEPGVGQYLVMEYLEGRPLDAVIRERAPLALAEALPLLCQVLDALSAAHAAGVIHRDLKPSNIFVVQASNGTEYVKVLDFGLAKRTDAPNGTTPQTHSNMIVGTPQYMAPEQALGGVVGPRTDLYSVGVIAFELLTGRRPFSGQSQLEVLLHHVQTLPPAPSSLVPLPTSLNELIVRLLAKKPQDRPESASEVAHELRAVLASGEEGVLSRSSASSEVRSASALAHAEPPTATVPPPAALALPRARAPARAAREPRWYSLGLVAGGGLAVALIASVLMREWTVDPVTGAPPSAPAGAASATRPQESAPPASEPQQVLPMPAPSLVTAPKASAATPTPPSTAVAREFTSRTTKKKTSRPVQPAAPTVLQPADDPVAPVEARVTTGALHLKVRGGWAYVWVDGHKHGRVPSQHIYPLTAGEHELELRRPASEPYRSKIVITPGDTLSHTVDFSLEAQGSPTVTP